MQTQAPYDYVRAYYEGALAKAVAFPDVARSWQRCLAAVEGGRCLNVGCGPTFLDYLRHFKHPPTRYVGVDINRATFEFLEEAMHPTLVEARRFTIERGVEVEHRCADVFEIEADLAGRFDCVIAVGFMATFTGERFARLCSILHRSLIPGGRLVKATWHGPRRTAEQTALKVKYRYDNLEETDPSMLASRIEQAGFRLAAEQCLADLPPAYGWESIQTCVFTKAGS